MVGRLSLLFAIVPVLELLILIKIGSRIGALNTVALVILAALLGLMLVRLEGLRTLRQIQVTLAQGQIPAEELLDGVLICIGGILLLTPGVLTDLFALVLLIPYLRRHFKRWLRRRFDRIMASGSAPLPYERSEPRNFLNRDEFDPRR
jgi:UPF0716 protein FxsA